MVTEVLAEVERHPDIRASEVHIHYTDAKGIEHSMLVTCADNGQVSFTHLRQTQQEQDQRTEAYLYGRMQH